MRPLHLTVHAVGPYATTETVDFRRLNDEGLFLIHGRTGAGKTFLLDALTFALFGEVGGARRSAALRSDFADRDAEPSVRLEFESHGSTWLVERVPRHERARRRGGDDPVEKPARAALSRFEHGEWSPVASGIHEVGAKVTELVGLTVKQFQQVIVLPQGNFEEVLRANSDKREELLKTLFETELYGHVATHLEQRAAEERQALESTQRELQQLRAQAVERWTEVASTRADADARALAPVPDLVEIDDQAGFEELATRLSHAAAELEQAAGDASDSARAAAVEHERIGMLIARFDERAQLRRTAQQLSERSDEVDLLRVRLGAADAAAGLIGPIEHATAAAATADAARSRRTDTIARLDRVRSRSRAQLPAEVLSVDLGAPESTAAQLLPAIQSARDAVIARATRLGALEQLQRDAERFTAQADDAAILATARQRSVEQCRTSLAEIDATVVELARQVEHATSAVARCPGLLDAAAAATSRADAAEQLVTARATALGRTADHVDADRALQDRRSALNDLRQGYLDGIAAELAGRLLDDASCPVCGSVEHPSPAMGSDATVTKDAVESAERSVEVATGTERAMLERRRDAEEAVRSLEVAVGDGDLEPEQLRAAATVALAALEAARVDAARLDQLSGERSALEQRRLDAETMLSTAVDEAGRAAARSVELRQRAQECERTVLDELGHDVRLVDAVRTTAQVAELLAEVADRLVDHDRFAALATEAGARQEQLVAESPFSDVAEAVAAALPAAERERLGTSVRRHDEQFARTTVLLGSRELLTLPDERPDDARARAALDEATLASNSAAAAAALWASADDAVRAWAGIHRKVTVAAATQLSRAQLLTEVAEQCSGKRGDKVSLQRWVLASYLDDICQIANHRLLTMSSGRYTLAVHRRRAKGAAKSGLDLRIRDAHTGEEREVHSLSGGETFQASLALALAVAESVQHHAGGVHLDTLFIDEGFGTLDPDSLDLAMDELDKLRAGGRMVGIISHVGALRERIRMGIEVTSTAKGSTLDVGEISAA